MRTDFSLSLRSSTSPWHPSPSASVASCQIDPSSAARADPGTDEPEELVPNLDAHGPGAALLDDQLRAHGRL